MRLEIQTPSGTAWVDLDRPRGAAVLLVLGHGAGGGVGTPDLIAVRDRACAAGVAVARVTQPYRVAGRRAPAPAPRLDEAWLAVIDALRRRRGCASCRWCPADAPAAPVLRAGPLRQRWRARW